MSSIRSHESLREPAVDGGSGGGGRPALLRRAGRASRLAAQFFLGQGAVQTTNLLIGLYLVRALSVESYAQYGLVTSFQQLAGLLMDLGFASTIVPLVGNRGADRAVIGRYVRSAKHLRDRAFYILSPVAAAVFLWIAFRHHWSVATQGLLLLSVLVSIYSSGQMSYYSAPLILQARLKELYLPQTLTGVGRLAAVVGLQLAGMLNGWVASAVAALNYVVSGKLLRVVAGRHIEWPARNDPETNGEMLRYILPAIPAMIFSAFQVQSSVLLVSAFGQTTAIAQVSALGRLGQLFSILTVFNAVIVEPSMSRLHASGIVRRYVLIVLMACVVCTPLVTFAFLRPDLILLLLGSKYAGLQRVVGWAVLAGALNYLQVLLWILNRSRKWVFWRGTVLEIGLTLAVQVAFVATRGVRTTSDAVAFAVVSCAGPLATHVYIACYGVFRGRSAGRAEEDLT